MNTVQLSRDTQHLQWIYNRLLLIDEGADPNVDYMLRFDEIIEKFVRNEVRVDWQARVLKAQTFMIVVLVFGVIAMGFIAYFAEK